MINDQLDIVKIKKSLNKLREACDLTISMLKINIVDFKIQTAPKENLE